MMMQRGLGSFGDVTLAERNRLTAQEQELTIESIGSWDVGFVFISLFSICVL